jgi:hypothetical protein
VAGLALTCRVSIVGQVREWHEQAHKNPRETGEVFNGETRSPSILRTFKFIGTTGMEALAKLLDSASIAVPEMPGRNG